jgi:hypothetical protein
MVSKVSCRRKQKPNFTNKELIILLLTWNYFCRFAQSFEYLKKQQCKKKNFDLISVI